MKRRLNDFIQGDVILRKVSNLPEGLIKVDTKILQQSEVTGHHHHFRPDANVEVYESLQMNTPSDFTTITPDQGKYIVVNEDGELLYHGKGFQIDPNPSRTGDHVAIPLEKGTYQILITREWDYNKNEAATVVD